MKKRIALILVVVLLCCFGLAACKARDEGEKNEEREELTKVTLNEVAHSIFYAPQYVAIEEGYFVEEGIKLELVTGLELIRLWQQSCQEMLILDLWVRNPAFMLISRGQMTK